MSWQTLAYALFCPALARLKLSPFFTPFLDIICQILACFFSPSKNYTRRLAVVSCLNFGLVYYPLFRPPSVPFQFSLGSYRGPSRLWVPARLKTPDTGVTWTDMRVNFSRWHLHSNNYWVIPESGHPAGVKQVRVKRQVFVGIALNNVDVTFWIRVLGGCYCSQSTPGLML